MYINSIHNFSSLVGHGSVYSLSISRKSESGVVGNTKLRGITILTEVHRFMNAAVCKPRSQKILQFRAHNNTFPFSPPTKTMPSTMTTTATTAQAPATTEDVELTTA